MADQTYVGTLAGVNVVIIESNEATELKRINDQFTASSHDVLMVMGLPDEAQDQEIIAAFEATLPIADSFILYYPADGAHIERNEPGSDPDVEPDSNYDLPRVIQSQIHLDVPYEFEHSWEIALQKAWQQSQPGSLLIVVAGDQDFDHTLTQLQAISRTIRHVDNKARPRAVELDQDAVDPDLNA